MNDVVLIAHVVAAILLLGPVTVAISMFPRLALAARDGEAGTVGAARTMHAITRTYGLFSLAVPLLGVGVMFTDLGYYMKAGALHTSILLAVIAWALLPLRHHPKQAVMMAGHACRRGRARRRPDFRKRADKAANLD